MEIFRSEFRAMACVNEVVVAAASPELGRAALQAACEEVLRIEAKYSRYRADSVVSRINAAAGGEAVAIDEETRWLLDFADALYRESEGLFDLTSGILRRVWNFAEPALPDPAALAGVLALIGWDRVERASGSVRLPQSGMEIDFGGVGKEYAADRAAQVLRAHGIAHAYVNLGGDIAALGPQPDGSPWLIGIADPRVPGRLIATLPLSRGGLATSGDYERFFERDGKRYCHILNPRSGWPVDYWQSVSVLAPLCIAAGAYATTAMLKESAAPTFLRAKPLSCLAVGPQGELLQINGPERATEGVP